MRKVIFLDRDGVLNKIVIHEEQGTIDSPMQVSEVEVFSWVPKSLEILTRQGFELVIVTNQPAAAKGKTTIANLKSIHEEVLSRCLNMVKTSKICFHRKEDGCQCRKPKPGLLLEYLDESQHRGPIDLAQSWMIGDGITDVQAGQAAGLKTAFLGPRKCDACKIFEERKLSPDFWGNDLASFTEKFI